MSVARLSEAAAVQCSKLFMTDLLFLYFRSFLLNSILGCKALKVFALDKNISNLFQAQTKDKQMKKNEKKSMLKKYLDCFSFAVVRL